MLEAALHDHMGVPLLACEVLVISALQTPAGKVHVTDTWKAHEKYNSDGD
jgi:hypothetical protein